MENYAVIYPIRPEYTSKIKKIEKIKEARTRLPKLNKPYIAFVYETKGKYKASRRWGRMLDDKIMQFYYKFPVGCVKYREGNNLYYTYTEHGQGKIVGYFIVDETSVMKYEDFKSRDDETIEELLKEISIDKTTLDNYLKGKDLKMLHIKNYKHINPVGLESIGIHFSPQSYIYISKAQAEDILRFGKLPF